MSKKVRNAPVWVKVFVGFHVVAITSWSIPQSARSVRPVIYKAENGVRLQKGPKEATARELPLLWNDLYIRYGPVRQYLLSLGLWQSWDMFSPNPSATDIYGSALIMYEDGTARPYLYPRMKLLPSVEKYVKERYRKFYERASSDQYSFLFPYFAERIALLNPGKPGSRPVNIILYKHKSRVPKNKPFLDYWQDIFNATSEGKLGMHVLLPPNPPLSKYEAAAYYEYKVDPVKFEAALKK